MPCLMVGPSPSRASVMLSLPTLAYSACCWFLAGSVARRGLRDVLQELLVRLGRSELVDQQLQGRARLEGVEHAPQSDHERQLLGREQELFLPRARGIDVDRREQ